MIFEPTAIGLPMKSSVRPSPFSTMTPPISWPRVKGHGKGFGQWPLRMCWSVPQTPQAPILISAAFFGTAGHGTVSMTGLAPGPAKVATRMSGFAMASSRLLLQELAVNAVLEVARGDRAHDGLEAEGAHVAHPVGAVEGRVRRQRQAAVEPGLAVDPGLDERVLGVGRFLRQHVEARRGDLAGAQGLVQGVEVDDGAARGVDEHEALLRRRKRLGVDEAPRRLGRGRVHADDVGGAHQLLEAAAAPGVDGDLEARGLIRIVEGDLEAEAARPQRRRKPDPAEPEDA